MKATQGMTLGQKLSRFAVERKMNVVAERAGIGRTALSKYMHTGTTPGADKALRLARALGVSVEWLIDDEQDWPPVYLQRDAATPSPNSDAA